MSALRRRWDEARLALMLLTRFPAGRIERDIPLGDASWAYPLAGLPVGIAAGVIHWGALALGASPTLAAILTLSSLAVATGGLHHDGLADFADGMGGRDREKRLAIMRDSRIGSYGVLALGLTLAGMGAALADLGAASTLAAFVALAVTSRYAMVVVLLRLPPARADGLGHAAHSQSGKALLVGVVVAALCLAPLGLAALPIVVAVALSTLLLARLARTRLGGQTGDVLGAVQLGSECAGWVALALWVGG